MKNFNLLKLLALPVMIGLMLSLSFCKKDTETVTNTNTVTVHDTLKGKAILGVATYHDMSGTVQNAKGAVVTLYTGSSANPANIAATAYANANGNYSFPYLLPGSYFVYAKYNTTNNNARTIDGINFATSPGYAVTLASADLTQNLTLVNFGATGTAKIAMDTINSNQTFRKVAFEAHSKLDFNFANLGAAATLAGGFNTFQMDYFVFDETNLANTKFSGYTLISSINTFEPARDAIGISGTGPNNLPATQTTGCTHGTLNNYVDSAAYYATPNSVNVPLAVTDTARYVCTSVEKYGDGYVAHGTLTAFYKHIANGPIAGSNYQYKSDTTGFAAGAGHPYNGPMVDGMISVPIDMYFNYDKQKVYSGANFNWWFVFEGQFSFKPVSQYYITSSHFADGPINMDAHVEFQGTKNVEY